MGKIADYITRKLKDEKNGMENTVEYLRSAFLSSAVDALFYARRKSKLTQEQVARKLGKKQEAITRWEADVDGKMSLRQYFDLAIASGMVPLNMVLEPIESVRNFLIENPEAPPTPSLYSDWLQKKSEPITPHTIILQVKNSAQVKNFAKDPIYSSAEERDQAVKSVVQQLENERIAINENVTTSSINPRATTPSFSS